MSRARRFLAGFFKNIPRNLTCYIHLMSSTQRLHAFSVHTLPFLLLRSATDSAIHPHRTNQSPWPPRLAKSSSNSTAVTAISSSAPARPSQPPLTSTHRTIHRPAAARPPKRQGHPPPGHQAARHCQAAPRLLPAPVREPKGLHPEAHRCRRGCLACAHHQHPELAAAKGLQSRFRRNRRYRIGSESSPSFSSRRCGASNYLPNAFQRLTSNHARPRDRHLRATNDMRPARLRKRVRSESN
jgi:hypothetical protein